MATISISKELIKEGFVVLPRREYEDLLRVKQQQNNNDDIVVKRDKSFKVPKRHEKFYDELDKDLTESLREYRAGNFEGPFNTAEEAISFLKSRKRSVVNK